MKITNFGKTIEKKFDAYKTSKRLNCSWKPKNYNFFIDLMV